MTITLKHLVQFLPMDEKVRQDTLAQMDSYSPDQKLALSELLWGMFYELMDADITYEFKKATADIKDGKRNMDKDLYRSIEDQVYQKYMRDMRDTAETSSINELRDDLKKMVTERVKTAATAKQS